MANGSMKKSRSPAPGNRNGPVGAVSKGAPTRQSPQPQSKSYASDGVKDNDIFLLPGEDYIWCLAITVIGAVVRLFRIYQPSSVVFDEVQ
jgi:dolichyl-phosphate-mannose-protein mannosyltransferase